jgi:hypothetical protein
VVFLLAAFLNSYSSTAVAKQVERAEVGRKLKQRYEMEHFPPSRGGRQNGGIRNL